jgi:hypothetical protein
MCVSEESRRRMNEWEIKEERLRQKRKQRETKR